MLFLQALTNTLPPAIFISCGENWADILSSARIPSGGLTSLFVICATSRAVQPKSVYKINRGILNVTVGIDAPSQPNRITLNIPAGTRIVISEVVVVEIGFPVELTLSFEMFASLSYPGSKNREKSHP